MYWLRLYFSTFSAKIKKVVAKGDIVSNSPLKNPWQALCAAKKKAAREGDNFQFSSILGRLYDLARTYFTTKN
jgi:hypothetical protein